MRIVWLLSINQYRMSVTVSLLSGVHKLTSSDLPRISTFSAINDGAVWSGLHIHDEY